MSAPKQVVWSISRQSLAEVAADDLNALDYRVLLYMIAKCTFHVWQVLGEDSFYIYEPSIVPRGMAGCFIYNGKRTDICDEINYKVPQNVSRSISKLIHHKHLSRTNILGINTMFAFVLKPSFFMLDKPANAGVRSSVPPSR